VSCPDFLNAMATARETEGPTSVAGLGKLLPTNTKFLDFKLALTHKRMTSMIFLNRSNSTLD
jgi:hypothetical protein